MRYLKLKYKPFFIYKDKTSKIYIRYHKKQWLEESYKITKSKLFEV